MSEGFRLTAGLPELGGGLARWLVSGSPPAFFFGGRFLFPGLLLVSAVVGCGLMRWLAPDSPAFLLFLEGLLNAWRSPSCWGSSPGAGALRPARWLASGSPSGDDEGGTGFAQTTR